jgi:hypothetical protein
MKLVDVVEFENFVSFVLEDDGEQVSAQYRARQLWRDEKDVWRVKRNERPVHITRSAVIAKTKPDVSGEVINTLAAAAINER